MPRSRCPNGSRKNRKTGVCQKYKFTKSPSLTPVSLPRGVLGSLSPWSISRTPSTLINGRRKRCKNGTRRNKKTGKCQGTILNKRGNGLPFLTVDLRKRA